CYREPEGMQEYQRMAAHFGRDLTTLQQELHRIKVATQEQVRERMSVHRKEVPTEIPKVPDFLVGLRSHTVWEKTPVKLLCTVSGYPTPIVKWYKNDIVIDPLSVPGKYKIENKYGVHGLIISRYELTHGIHRSKLEVFLLESFGVTFGNEGESLTLVANMVVVPDLPNLPPEVMWYRDDILLKPSRWVEMSVGGGTAKLTFPHLNKDDEGLYTLRIWTKDGTTEHSAYLFVKDAPPTVNGAPGAPMDVTVSDANKEYVLVSWKPPNTTNEPLITGYFVDRRKSGTNDWVQCNATPVKVCKLPVHGLSEGASYHFRVRAVNSAGISLPSRMSTGVTAADVESDIQVIKIEGKLCVTLPGPPTDVHASEINQTYIVLSWNPPSPRGQATVWYLIEKSVGDSNFWQRVNTGVQIRSPRCPIFDLEDKKAYRFRVISVNKHGPGQPSEPTALLQKADPYGVPSAPGQVMASRNTKTSAFVHWEPPKNPNNLIGYYVDCCVVGSKVWTPCNHRFVVHGLTAGDTYLFRVQAVNAYGLSEESQVSAPLFVDAALAAPSAPYGIALLSCDGSSMTVAWKCPKRTGGSRITSYYLDKREADSVNWKEVSPSPATKRVYKVENLTAGLFYEFKVQAANLAGVGLPSEPSRPFACEAWTMPQPGPAYDLSFWEVRDDSLLLQWKAPVYVGASPVTGYFVEMAKKGSPDFVVVNTEAVNRCYLKVTGLETGAWYVFKVYAVNVSGKGKDSDVSEAVCAKTLQGTKGLVSGVDEETGDIFLSFEAPEISELSEFIWSKSYKEITDSSRVKVSTVGRRSRLTLLNPEKEDLGLYSVAVTEADGASASHTVTEEELKKLFELSYNIRNPIVPLKTELNYEILEKGHVRFWLQAQKISSAVSYRFIINDKEVTRAEGHKISHDASTGIIQMTVEHFTRANEGTYTLQIHDGKAKSQSSLVLVGDVFKVVLKEAEFQRKEHIRKQAVLMPTELAGQHTGELGLPSKWLTILTGSSASDLMMQCTPEGIRLQCYMKYYTEEMKTSWFHKESKIASSEKMRIGGTCEMAWMQICEPTDREKGHYSIEIHDGKNAHIRTFDLSGQGKSKALSAFTKMPLFCVDRGRVVGGLPDVVTIMEYKTLSLTCTVWGDPKPEVTWFKNEQEVVSDDHNQISFESGKFASLTIKSVTVDDSGKYSINVRNKYGGEFVEITVSVYKQGEQIPEPKLGKLASTSAFHF
uniref:Myomesin 2a n=1 Tax=Electrophorus electricus TaxID=8005 RepID=A0A4W4G4L2_ELEEL